MSQETTDGNEDTLASKWVTLLLFIAFSALEVWVLIDGNLKFEKLSDWMFVAGAFMFPFFALTSAQALTKDVRLNGPAKKLATLLKWAFAAPFAIIAAIAAIWLLFSIFGWFASIPGWAAVIIVLLLLKG